METFNNIGRYTVLGLTILWMVAVVVGLVFMFYAVIRALFFSSEGIRDSHYRRVASNLFVMLRWLKVVWWVILILSLAWVVVAVIFGLVHK
jgi:hypothetical protein